MDERMNGQEILKKRARILAQVDKSGPEGFGTEDEFIAFQLLKQGYCLEKKYIGEVLRLKETTVIPGIPDYFQGIVNVRGRLVVLLNLLPFLGIPTVGISEQKEIILVKKDRNEIGIMVDKVLGIYKIPENEIKTSETGLSYQQFVRGISTTGMILLDLGRMLDDKRLIVKE